jgi:hypothetical protein
MRIALLGAGFTRNWGGWLASELVGELCGRVDDDVELLQRLKETRNFEKVLGEIRQKANQSPEHQRRFDRLQDAVRATFDEMNQMLARETFEFGFSGKNWPNRWIVTFLAEFDAIFTLNQDLFLEMHYVPGKSGNDAVKWRATCYPGIALPIGWLDGMPPERLGPVLSESGSLEHDPKEQPIYKLHGSVNWLDKGGSQILVIGDGKDAMIGRSALLSNYLTKFREHLSAGDTKLMVVGYSFTDDHVNKVLEDASNDKGLKTYLVNPAGLAVFDPPPGALITSPSNVFKALKLSGILTRPFRDAFISDELAFNSFQRFLHGNR